MSTYTLPLAWDSQVGGIPPGDQGRSSGKWFANGGADFGHAVFAFNDGRDIFIQANNVDQPRIRFAPNQANIAELAGLVSATGAILSVTPWAYQRRQRVTFSDTAPISFLTTMERPASTNLTTMWAGDIADVVYALSNGPAVLTDPAGLPWTAGLLGATAFSLSIVTAPSNAHPYISQYYIDQFYLVVEYVEVCNPFPMPTVGGATGCSGTLGTAVTGAAHGDIV